MTLHGTESQFEIPRETRLIVRGTNGSIVCRHGSGSRVRVVAVRRDPPELPHTRFIEVHLETGGEYVVKCRYCCSRVPAAADLEMELPGHLDSLLVETLNGSIIVEGVGCPVKAMTCNGFIRCNAPCGPLDLQTRNGRIDTIGLCTISSISTTLGDVRAEIGSIPASGASISAVTGSIEICLPPDASLFVDAATGRGRLSAQNLGMNSPEAGHGSIRGAMGPGGPRLLVRTRLGDLALTSRKPGQD